MFNPCKISFVLLSAAVFQVTSPENLINAGIMALQISWYPREKSPRGIGVASNLACLLKFFHPLSLTSILPLR